MRSTTQFEGEIAELQYPHALAVFFAKNGGRPGLEGVVEIHDRDVGIGVGTDFRVDQPLDFRQFFLADRPGVGEVEPQVIGGDQRATLLHVLAQHLLERGVKQVGCRMVEDNGLPPLRVNARFYLIADGHPAVLDSSQVGVENSAQPGGVLH